MKEFILDLKDGCSARNNPKNWTFYLMCAAILVLTIIGTLSGIVSTIIYIVANNFQILPVIISVVCIIIFIGIVILVNKLR